MAAGLLTRRLRERGLDAEVGSAGRLPGGRASTPENVTVMRRFGVDLTGHRSRAATPDEVRRAELVLGMAREHVRDAVDLAPEMLPRTFTLKELVRRGEAIGPRPPAEPLEDWLARAAAGRRAPDLLGSSTDDDVPDPIGAPIERYERVAAEVAALVTRVVDLAWPRSAPPPSAGGAGEPGAAGQP
jgi:protein-tyrosine phosphatase